MLLATVAFFITYGPVEAALPLLVREELRGSASAYGLLWSAYGASAAVGALIAPVLGASASKAFAPIILLHGLLVVVMGVATSYTLIALSMFAIGLVYGPYGSLAAAEVQRLTPFHHQTKAHSLWASATMPAIPLGASLGGFLVSVLGVRSSMVVSGVSMMLVAAGSAFFLRRTADGGLHRNGRVSSPRFGARLETHEEPRQDIWSEARDSLPNLASDGESSAP
jgi:predicted MFS family arabinose efflux permease